MCDPLSQMATAWHEEFSTAPKGVWGRSVSLLSFTHRPANRGRQGPTRTDI